jgi:heme exporter protein CcmB
VNALRGIILLAAKDLRVEARGRQTISLVLVLGVLIVVVLALGLGPGRSPDGVGATAILWVAYLFGGVLCFEKTMGAERHDDALAALLLAPIDRGAIFIAKLATNLVLMAGLALVVTPVGIVLFRFDLSAAPVSFGAIMGLSMIGFASVGTLFSAAVASTRLQGGLLAVLVFPLCLPVVLTSTQQLLGVFRDGRALDAAGLSVLIAFDVIFVVASWLIFETLLEP